MKTGGQQRLAKQQLETEQYKIATGFMNI